VLLTSNFHKHLVEMPLPLYDLRHVRGTLTSDLSSKHWTETIYPLLNALMADIDVTFME
jgi:hypothetical protein